MKVELRRLEDIIPYARNPRANEKSVANVAASIQEFGWQQPIVVDDEGVIVAGHTRLLAARQLGFSQAPVKVAEGLSDEQIRAYRLMDNRSHEDSTWDKELLSLEVIELNNMGFDLELTGFEMDELGDILGGPPTGGGGSDGEDGADGENPDGDDATNMGTGVARYELIFEDESQQDRWFEFLRYLKAHYPDQETIGGRLIEFIDEHTSD